jgi:branched-chain amino acid transport system permease protein
VTARRLFPSVTPARWAGVTVLVLLVAAFPLVESNQYVLTVIVHRAGAAGAEYKLELRAGCRRGVELRPAGDLCLGGYGAGILMLHTPLPPWLAVLGGGVIAAFISVLLAFPTLRLYGIYTSLLTFAFAEIVQDVIINDGSGLTGGSYGFPTVPGLYSSLSPEASMRAYYWTTLGVVAAIHAGLAAHRHSHLGIAVRAVRDAPGLTPPPAGSSSLRYRIIAFAISGFLAGIAGALYISFNQSISPSAMGLTPMSIDVTMLVIGGLGTVFGPLIGTALLTIVQTAWWTTRD